jgi:hypothetical protein
MAVVQVPPIMLLWSPYWFQKLMKSSLLKKYHIYIGFEVLTAVDMKSTSTTSIFWDITPCSPLKFNRRFRYSSTLKMEAICFSETSVDF